MTFRIFNCCSKDKTIEDLKDGSVFEDLPDGADINQLLMDGHLITNITQDHLQQFADSFNKIYKEVGEEEEFKDEV